MSTKVKHKKDLCTLCGGELHHTLITHEERHGKNLYIFQNVPAKVCSACGEIWIDDSVIQEIDRLIREGKPTRKVETPVYDLAGVK